MRWLRNLPEQVSGPAGPGDPGQPAERFLRDFVVTEFYFVPLLDYQYNTKTQLEFKPQFLLRINPYLLLPILLSF
jgi:hypothetical protein